MEPLGSMLTLPVEEGALIVALASCLKDSRAGLLYSDGYEDGDVLASALDTASARLGIPIRRQWLGHGRDVLAWLREDDARLRAQPDLAIVGVML